MFRTLISEILSAQTRSDLCLCVTCTISKLIFDPVFFFRWFGVLFGQRLCVIRVSLLHRVNILLSGWVHLYRNLDLSQHWVRSYIFKNNTLISICWFIKKMMMVMMMILVAKEEINLSISLVTINNEKPL